MKPAREGTSYINTHLLVTPKCRINWNGTLKDWHQTPELSNERTKSGQENKTHVCWQIIKNKKFQCKASYTETKDLKKSVTQSASFYEFQYSDTSALSKASQGLSKSFSSHTKMGEIICICVYVYVRVCGKEKIRKGESDGKKERGKRFWNVDLWKFLYNIMISVLLMHIPYLFMLSLLPFPFIPSDSFISQFHCRLSDDVFFF